MIATTTSNSISVKARRFEIRATFDDFPNFLKSGVTTGNQQRSRLREKLARRQPDYGNGFCAFGTDFTGGNTATFFISFGRCVPFIGPFYIHYVLPPVFYARRYAVYEQQTNLIHRPYGAIPVGISIPVCIQVAFEPQQYRVGDNSEFSVNSIGNTSKVQVH